MKVVDGSLSGSEKFGMKGGAFAIQFLFMFDAILGRNKIKKVCNRRLVLTFLRKVVVVLWELEALRGLASIDNKSI